MDEALQVGVGQGVEQLTAQGHHASGSEGPLLLDKGAGAGAINVFHDEVEQAAHFARFMEGDDVRMGKVAEDGRLALEARRRSRLRRRGGRDHLQGDELSIGGSAGFVDDAHAAPAQFLQEFIARNDGPGRRRRRVDGPSHGSTVMVPSPAGISP